MASGVRLSICASIVALLSALGSSARANDDDKIRILHPTPFADNSDIPDRVKKDCADIGRELAPAVSRGNPEVVMVKTEKELTAKKGRYFKVEITDVHAVGGGVWTGPKHMKVRGVLYANGKQVADVEVKRGSAMAFGVCQNLEKVEKVLGKDLAGWLRNPKPGDKLQN